MPTFDYPPISTLTDNPLFPRSILSPSPSSSLPQNSLSPPSLTESTNDILVKFKLPLNRKTPEPQLQTPRIYPPPLYSRSLRPQLSLHSDQYEEDEEEFNSYPRQCHYYLYTSWWTRNTASNTFNNEKDWYRGSTSYFDSFRNTCAPVIHYTVQGQCIVEQKGEPISLALDYESSSEWNWHYLVLICFIMVFLLLTLGCFGFSFGCDFGIGSGVHRGFLMM